MLPDYKSRCPSMAPLLQPQRRKYLFGGIGLFIVILGILLIVFIVTSGDSDSFVLDRTPLFAGRNNLPQNLHLLVGNNLSMINLDSNLKNDTIFGKNCSTCNTDIPRLCQGQVSSQFWVARAGCNETTRTSDAISQLDVITRMIQKYSNNLQLVKQSKDLKTVFENKKLGSLIAIDGGQAIMESLAFLRVFYELGVRALTLANGCSSPTVVFDYIEQNGSLTLFGKDAVREMNRLGIMIDIQGLSAESQTAIMNISTAPVMMSHTAASGLNPNIENVDDHMLDSIKSNNGLIMITFDAPFLGPDDNITKSDVVKHINYIVDKIGYDNIAIGGNYDSIFKKPLGLEDVSDFPHLFKELQHTNSTKWTPENLDRLAGLNFGRFFQDVENAKNTTKIMTEE